MLGLSNKTELITWKRRLVITSITVKGKPSMLVRAIDRRFSIRHGRTLGILLKRAIDTFCDSTNLSNISTIFFLPTILSIEVVGNSKIVKCFVKSRVFLLLYIKHLHVVLQRLIVNFSYSTFYNWGHQLYKVVISFQIIRIIFP